MSQTSPQTRRRVAAELALDNGPCLRGEVTLAADGRLHMNSVRLAGGGGDSKLNVALGASGTLSFPALVDAEGRIGELAITVHGAGGKGLALLPAAPEEALARRCIAALAKPLPGGANAPLMPKAALLEEYRHLSVQLLTEMLSVFLGNLTEHLLELNPGNQANQASRSTVSEAVTVLQLKRKAIIRSYIEHFLRYHENLTPPPSERNQWWDIVDDGGALDLVDLTDFEDYLAVERLVNIGEDLHRVALETLLIRVATLIDAEPLTVRLPEHVGSLSRALQQVMDLYRLPHRLMPQMFDHFVIHFVRRLDTYYDTLNQFLVQAGIRPELEEEIRVRGSLLRRPQPQRRERAVAAPTVNGPENAGNPAPAAAAPPAPAANTGSFSPENLYRSVIDALNFKREVEGGAPEPAGNQPLADAQSVVRALATLQRNTDLRQEIQRAGSIAEYLVAQGSRLEAMGSATGLSSDSRNQLDLVDSLFGTIDSQLDVSTALKPTLGNLQIPLARLALLEPHFFLDPGHPARSLLDKLSVLASSANFPNKMLESRVAGIVDEIVERYDRDTAVFDSALASVEKLVQQQERAHARNLERVVKTQEGKEKLQQARDAVARVIQDTVKPPEAPQVLLQLIEHGWRDLMVLTHVKEGPGSREWQEQVRTLGVLASWLVEQHQGEVDEDLLVQRSLEAEPFIDMIEQQVSSALPGNVGIAAVLEDLRAILAGEQALIIGTVTSQLAPDAELPSQLRARLDKTRRLRRWVRRVEQLETGNWLNYRDREGQRHRMQLAWISDQKDRYLFVNDRGQKVAELNRVQLARQLSRGAQPPAPADTLSVVEKSMYGTLEHVQRSLSFARNHDTLTQLINQDTFLSQLGRTLKHAHQHTSQHAVLLLNIDQFSLVNEVYDRISGDQVLQEFSRLLAQLHGKKQSSARLSGDEFAVLLVDRDLDQAAEVADGIRRDIATSSVEINGERVSFTVSIGIAPILDYSPGVDEVMAYAQTALAQAKQEGRDRVVIYRESQEAVSQFRQEQGRSRRALEQALESERFVLRAQPIVQTAVDGRFPATRHYELLLAMRDKDGSLISPQPFISSAERYGFMTLVDRWVVREAFRWISSLMDAQKVVPNLAINLSGASVTDDAFLDYLFEQISEFGVGTNRLCFEITETGTISNLIKAADFVRAFRNIGCKFSIDDFGTGLASHNYLRELPVDYVKIDGSFITNIHENRNDYAMARSINDLAHFLGQQTIAESVENDAIIEQLQEIGVDFLQGWGVGRPKPLDEVTLDLSSIEK